jgi:hypothetical protein
MKLFKWKLLTLFGRLIVFAPFLIIIIILLSFFPRTMNLSTADLRNYCCVLVVILKMADILKILKTQNCSSNGDLSLCQILCLYHYLFRSYQETWWSYRYMFLVDPKVFRFVVNGVKAIYLGVQRGWGLL